MARTIGERMKRFLIVRPLSSYGSKSLAISGCAAATAIMSPPDECRRVSGRPDMRARPRAAEQLGSKRHVSCVKAAHLLPRHLHEQSAAFIDARRTARDPSILGLDADAPAQQVVTIAKAGERTSESG